MLSFQNKSNFCFDRLFKNGTDRSAFKTTADRRLQKASVSCKVFLNHYSVHTVYNRNTYNPDKEDCFPTVGLPGLKNCLAWEARKSHRAAWRGVTAAFEQKVMLSFPIFTPHIFSSKITLSLLSRALEPPSLAALWAWYDHSLDKHSSTMRSQKCFFFSSFSLSLSSQTKPEKMPLVSGFWWELWVCFQFRVIPGTRRFLSKNRQYRK